jgi:Fructose-bisphosphate aldolase class-I
MNTKDIIDTAKALVSGDKGLLAMDESNPTCNKRFAALGIHQNEGTRRAYREMIVTTPGLGESISGAILYDETIRQQKKDGTSFVKALLDAGIIPVTGFRTFECYECPFQITATMGIGVFICTCHPTTGIGDMARQRNQCAGSPKSIVSSSKLQQGCAPWRI